MAAEERAARLLGMVAALEEAIIRFEEQSPAETRDTVLRLRQLQDEIFVALLHREVMSGRSSVRGRSGP